MLFYSYVSSLNLPGLQKFLNVKVGSKIQYLILKVSVSSSFSRLKFLNHFVYTDKISKNLKSVAYDSLIYCIYTVQVY